MPSPIKIAASASAVAASLVLVTSTTSTAASDHGMHRATGLLRPGHLLLSSTTYTVPADAITVGQTVLPGCTLGTTGDPNCTAVADASYPGVFNNEAYDPSFGITTPISLQLITPSGHTMSTVDVPTATNGDHLVTSFPSKSELGLNLATGGDALTFMGYVAPVGAIDISNANTQAGDDPTNPVGLVAKRAVAKMLPYGTFTFTETNAYSGNNGRAAILADTNGLDEYFMSGNAGNGGNPEPAPVVAGAGAQVTTPSTLAEALQSPGTPTAVSYFNIAQLGLKPDKTPKDSNFRGLTIHNNVIYLTKGSGGNGVNTVYYVDTANTCHNGVGIPSATASLPTTGGNTICILKGFNTTLAKAATNNAFPFGVWFANDTTMYVADEGSGSNTYDASTGVYTAAASSTTAGLQKWVLQNGQWNLAYTIQNGLGLGQKYGVKDYPTTTNPATGLPWTPATDGLRNITGRVNADGTVTIWGITSTVSGATDEGADPNRLVRVTDVLDATSAHHDRFTTLRTARSGEALRGIAYVPGN